MPNLIDTLQLQGFEISMLMAYPDTQVDDSDPIAARRQVGIIYYFTSTYGAHPDMILAQLEQDDSAITQQTHMCGCGQPNYSSDPDVLCSDCRETYGHAFASEL